MGTTAALNSQAFVGGGDADPRNRPSLAQAFRDKATGGTFVAVANHLKSKGSACTVPDAGDGQGNCNAVRVRAAQLLSSWLATDPTATGDPDVLILGDLNSYAMEDPIATLEGAGFTNLLAARNGREAYSYVFDGQWGYLDHAPGISVDPITGDRGRRLAYQRRRARSARLQHRVQVGGGRSRASTRLMSSASPTTTRWWSGCR